MRALTDLIARAITRLVISYKVGIAGFGLILIPLIATATVSSSDLSAETSASGVATTPVTLSVDGQLRDFVSHAGTVSGALAEAGIGLGEFDAVEPAPASPLTGVQTRITVVRAMPTTVIDGGVVVATRAAAPDRVEKMLASLGVPLGAADQVSSALSTDFTSGRLGQTVTITRAAVTETVEIPAPTRTKTDATLAVGATKVQIPGVAGQKTVTYRWVFTPGKGYARQVISEAVLKQPVTQVVLQGAKNPVVTVAGDDAFARLRQCEAGGNYARNSGNGYYGAYQFDIGTWNGFGGYARADLAPPAVQDQKARDTQARRGWSPWPACARKLGLM